MCHLNYLKVIKAGRFNHRLANSLQETRKWAAGTSSRRPENTSADPMFSLLFLFPPLSFVSHIVISCFIFCLCEGTMQCNCQLRLRTQEGYRLVTRCLSQLPLQGVLTTAMAFGVSHANTCCHCLAHKHTTPSPPSFFFLFAVICFSELWFDADIFKIWIITFVFVVFAVDPSNSKVGDSIEAAR